MKLYFALDVETTGLNYDGSDITKNRLLQIAYQILNEDMEVLYKGSHYIKDQVKLEELWNMDPYVFDMHCATGLIQELQKNKGLNCSYVEGKILREFEQLSQFLGEEKFIIIPMGNNVQFDVEVIRRHMPTLFSKFHYSFLDVSCVRNAFGFANKEFPSIIYNVKKSNHNAEIDVDECVKEFKIYTKLLKSIPNMNTLSVIDEEVCKLYDDM